MKKVFSPFGFSLIEILVVIAMVALLGVIITELFFRSFLGSNKATVISNIKQNGQSTLEQMDKSIRGAERIIEVCQNPLNPENPQNTPTIVIYQEEEGIYTRFRFNPPVPFGSQKSNGYISSDNLSGCSDPTPTSSSSLTDRNISKGVSLTNGKFEFRPVPGFKDVVTITFSLGPAISSGANFLSSIDPVEFRTTIELR